MVRRVAVALVCLALIGSACSKAKSTSSTAPKGNVFGVSVDHKDKDLNTSFTHFFPHELKAHPGDTLEFTENFSGEPHTVAFGKVLDDAFAAIKAKGLKPGDDKAFDLPEVQKVPQFFPFGPNAPK